MQKLKEKITQIPIIQKLNHYQFMPIIWWSILVCVLPYLASLCHVPVVWRVGLIFLIINNVISYHVGSLIQKLKLKKWWLVLLPFAFCLVILPHFANYNLIFGIIYLILEVFGIMGHRLYR